MGSTPRHGLSPRFAWLIGCFLAVMGCHQSSELDATDAGADTQYDLDVVPSDTPVDGTQSDAVIDASDDAMDGGLPDTAVTDVAMEDVPLPCPEPSTIQAFHPAAHERRFARALAISGDGSTLAVSSDETLSIYERREESWTLVHQRTILETGFQQPRGIDINDSGDTVIWAAVIFPVGSEDFSSALVP